MNQRTKLLISAVTMLQQQDELEKSYFLGGQPLLPKDVAKTSRDAIELLLKTLVECREV